MPTHSQILQLRRGSKGVNDAYTGKEGELTYDWDSKTIRAHDEATPGGQALAREKNDLAEGVVRSSGLSSIQTMFQSDYDALTYKDPLILYIIVPRKVVMQPGAYSLFGNLTGIPPYN